MYNLTVLPRLIATNIVAFAHDITITRFQSTLFKWATLILQETYLVTILNYYNDTDLFGRRRIRTGKEKEEVAGKTDQPLDNVLEANTVGEDPGIGFSVCSESLFLIEIIDPYIYVIIVIKSTKS